jgi:glycosyltransferase involved in cell wall biosynthesis
MLEKEIMARRKIGYLVPGFPSQTHLFLWREIKGLSELGVDCDLISTQRPPKSVVSHEWAHEAQKRTTYLLSGAVRSWIGGLKVLVSAGPRRWAQCLSVIAGPSDLSFKDRVKLAFLVLPATKVAWLAKIHEFDHLHVQSCADSAHIAMLASLLSGLRYSLSLLGPTLEGYGPNQRNKWRYASFGVVMSQLLHKVVKERLSGSLPPIVEVLPVGVDMETMKRARDYVPWSGSGVCRIYSCGRLNKVKGHRDLITAIGLLRQRGIPAELVIAGEDEQGGTGYRVEIEDHIKQSNAGDFVTLLGAVGETQHRSELERAHVFALASLNEGISVAIMEAMAMQTPVVVTNVGGNAELIDDGQNGVFTVPEAPETFADALQSVLLDPEYALRLTHQSRMKVAEKFDSRANAALLVSCLERTSRS